MKLAKSGSRGVFWRANERGTQEQRLGKGRRERGDWWIRWACPQGHLHRVQVGPKALAQRESERHRIERPCPLRQQRPTRVLLSDVICDYLSSVEGRKRSFKDDKRYGEIWSKRFAGHTLDEVTPAELDKIRTERLAASPAPASHKERPRKAVSPATVNRGEFAFLKHVYNVAIRDGKTASNPVAKLRMLRESSRRVRYLSDEEEERLMRALPTDADRQRVTVLLHTGFRRSELLGLHWNNVDFKAGVLTIPRSKNGDTRHVPMTTTVRSILGRLPRPLDAAALVFPNSEGNRDLRWAKKIVPVQRYAHLSPSHRRTAIERLVTRQVMAEPTKAAGAE